MELGTAAARLPRLGGPVLEVFARSGLSLLITDPGQPGNPITYVNAGFTEMTGFPPEEAIGRDCRLLEAPDTDPATAAALAAALAEGRPGEFELRHRRRDGRRFWDRVTVVPVPPGFNRPGFAMAILTDNTATWEESAAQVALRSRQEALDKLQERLRAALSASGVMASWDWTIGERGLRGDAPFAAVYGLTAEEATSGVPTATFFSIIHPDDQARIRLAVGGILRGAEVFSKEYRIRLPDGTIRWVHARGRRHEAEDETASRFTGTMVDVTEQKRVEERLRIAQTAGGVGTFEYTSGYGTVSVSEQFCQVLGLQPAQDLPLRTINALIHPDDPPLIDPAPPPGAGCIRQVEFRITRPDTGEQRWLTRRGEFLRDIETDDLRFSGVIYDITASKRGEETLRRLNDELEARVAERTADRNRLWRLSAELMLVARFDGTITAANPASAAVLGWTEIELLGRDLFELVHPDEAAATRREFAALADGAPLARFDNRCRRQDGSWRWISWSAAAGEGLINAVGRDITAATEQAEALRQAEEQLRQAQKMEAVGQLTGGIAHDFNNLLTGIIGSLQMLRTRVAQGRLSQVDRYVTAAQGAANRAAALTHRLLAFSRRQTLAPAPTDVNRLIIGMEELVRRTMGPAIRVETALAAELWPTLCDPNQLENALLNLCINARDAMPDGGLVTIATANASLGEAEALQQGMAAGDYVSVAVSDTGTGMSPEVMARAFDPFFTTKPIGQGTGLGLSMIYGFAKQSGGQIRIRSELGCGTTMSIFLPRHATFPTEEEAPMNAEPASRAGQGETVLIVDDEPTVRMLVREVLEELGYHAVEAVDGAAALLVLQSDIRLDLLVTDVGLPGGMNGRQIADAGRALRPGLQALFITGYAEGAALGQGQLEPWMHILHKPFEVEALASKVQQIIRQAEKPKPAASFARGA